MVEVTVYNIRKVLHTYVRDVANGREMRDAHCLESLGGMSLLWVGALQDTLPGS